MLRHLEPILVDWAAAFREDALREDAIEDVGREARIKAIRKRIARAFAQIRSAASVTAPAAAQGIAKRFATTVERTNRAAMNAQFEAVSSIQLFGKSPAIDEMLRETIRENATRIVSIPTKQISQVEEVMHAALQRGTRVETLRDQISERFAVSESRASTIARTETSTFNAKVAQARVEDLGVVEYEWSCSNDERVRGRPGGTYEDSSEDHWHLNGKVFRYDDPPVVDEKHGIRANPGERPNCRCVAKPRVSSTLDALGIE